VVLAMGIDGSIEAEGHDRTATSLPGKQPDLVTAVLALGKPTVLVLIHGGAMSLGPLKDASPAILDAFYGGEKAAAAIASVVFGDYNPSGKLPMTMYPASFAEQVPLTQMSVTQAPGRTHMYYTGQPEFEFGDGLSYDAWEAQWHQHPGTTQPGGQGEQQEGPAAVALTTEDGSSATFKVKVGNKGTFGGACTLLAFWRPLGAAADRHIAGTVPLKQKLFGFGGVRVSAGGSGVVELTLKSEHLAVSNELGHQIVAAGEYEVFFKGAGVGAATQASTLRANVTVTGTPRTVAKLGF